MKITVFARRELAESQALASKPVVLLEGSWPLQMPGCLYRSLDESVDSRFHWLDVLASNLAEELCEITCEDGRHFFARNSLEATASTFSSTSRVNVENLGNTVCAKRESNGSGLYSSADLNVLALRYYLLKLARIVAFFTEVQPLRAGDELEVVLSPSRDEDLADLFAELAAVRGAICSIRWQTSNGRIGSNGLRGMQIRNNGSTMKSAVNDASACGKSFPKNGRLRRYGGCLARLVEPRKDIASHRQRVVLCGNPRVLEPVAEELLKRDCQLWWLYDRFAVKSWLRWRRRGIGQLFCDSSLGDKNRLAAHLPESLSCLGVNLTPAVGRWLAEQIELYGRSQTRAVREINSHFRHVRPNRIVLSESATPFARAAVHVARLYGATSFTLQHGAARCRFGYIPIASDYFLAWGQSSKEQLVDWGAEDERIFATGSPQHDIFFKQSANAVTQRRESNENKQALLTLAHSSPRVFWGKSGRATGILQRLNWADVGSGNTIEAARQLLAADLNGQPIRSPRILLLTSTPPRDDRPGSIVMHYTSSTYAQMLRIALTATAKIDGATLELRPHPRAGVDPVLNSLLSEFKSLPITLTRNGSLAKSVARADCVLSCMSTAGVEAASIGAPVIQILPQGSADVMPERLWGLLGSARSQDELDRLLSKVLLEGWRSSGTADENVFATPQAGATAATVQAILEQSPLTSPPMRLDRKEVYDASRQNVFTT